MLGGSGAIIGAVLGAWFLTQIDSVLVLLRIPAWWNDFIAGMVLLAVLVFDGRLRCALERNVFLIGQSPRVAVYSAIPVNRTLCALYAMTGLASAVAAVLLVSYFGSARSDLGASFLMPAITAVVLGGANIYGGSGSIIGTAIAVLLVGYLQQGLQMAGVPNQVSSALSGALLIVVVVGRSVSLHRQQIKEWLARRANNPFP